MILKIDTENKMITIEQNVNIGELMNMLMRLFPDEEWLEYTLDAAPKTILKTKDITPTLTPRNPYGNPYTRPETYCSTLP